MIQAPQTQYIPAYQPVTSYQQQGACSPVQYNQAQTPGVIYNYPAASCYVPQQPYYTPKSQYNGVNIEILNPQGQGIAPQAAYPAYIPVQNAMPAQFIPVQQQYTQMQPVQTAQQVQYPQMQPAQYVQQPVQYQQPAQFIPQQQVQYPQMQPVVNPNQACPTSQAIIQAPQSNIPAPSVQQPVVNPVVAEPVKTIDSSISPETFAGKLKTNDLDAQRTAIEEIAEMVKNNETQGPVLLDTQIFDALMEIINKDTSSLEGPSAEVIKLRQKPQEQLTDAEKAKALTPSEFEKAEINKQYSLYTISYLQERLNNEIEKRNGSALELKDLPCIEDVIDTVKANPNPMLRVGAIASLAHIARPEYKDDLSVIFELAKDDEDDRVREAATKAAEALQ